VLIHLSNAASRRRQERHADLHMIVYEALPTFYPTSAGSQPEECTENDARANEE